MRETFLVLNDDEARPDQDLEARRLSLEPAASQDPGRERGNKHRRDSDEMSVGSESTSKRPDKTKSSEKRK
jgi:hypothetical protein